MTFKEYQATAQTTAIYPGKGFDLCYPVLGLNGEAGEVAEKYKKCLRDCNGIIDSEMKEALAKELGDVLWYLSDIAFELGYSLQTIAEMNISKLLSRKNRNKIHGAGDDR